MTNRAMHGCAVALGLLLSVPAVARAQDVKDLRPATRSAPANAAPAPTPASAQRAPVAPTRAVDAESARSVAPVIDAKRATQSPARERRWKRRVER